MRFYPALLIALFVVFPVSAEAKKKTGWSTTAEAGIVVTSGNSDTQTVSFKDQTTRTWEKSTLRFKAGAIRSETTTTTRTAVDLGGGPVVTETELTATNAESYYFEGRFDKRIHENLFWFAGAGWDKNEPGGIDNRTTAFGGVGNTWRDDDKIKFRTDYAVSYTDQEDVVPSASSVGDYAGLRASWDYEHQLAESTEYTNDFVLDYGLDNSDNWRAGMINAVTVAINSKLALKVSLQYLYNNLPPTKLLTVVDGAGVPIPLAPAVPFELDELDTIFGAALVLKF